MLVLILAGGSGTRLWPLSRNKFPKQFLHLDNEPSFLQKTIERNLELTSRDKIFVVTSSGFYEDVKRESLPYLSPSNILIEPLARNTAPALCFALRQINMAPEEVIVVTPSDHLISPVAAYLGAMRRAEQVASQGHLVVFGVRPNRPETGYGYLYADGEKVKEFKEKPSVERAIEYLQNGNYFWNAGIFVFTKSLVEEELDLHTDWFSLPFEKMPSISLDYALMEKSKKLRMVFLEANWSDVGSWENIYELSEKDENKNVLRGDVCAMETTSSLILAKHRHISTIGLSNVVVIDTEDAVLVADMAASQKVKLLVDKLKKEGKREIEEPATVIRPWGSYTVFMQGHRYKIKKIFVKPHHKLSLQSHYHRSEHWVVVSGTAKVTIGEEEKLIHEGESAFVPKSELHRLENPGRVPLEIIEVQVGEYLGEDDIVRYEDVYGREVEDSLVREFVHRV